MTSLSTNGLLQLFITDTCTCIYKIHCNSRIPDIHNINNKSISCKGDHFISHAYLVHKYKSPTIRQLHKLKNKFMLLIQITFPESESNKIKI